MNVAISFVTNEHVRSLRDIARVFVFSCAKRWALPSPRTPVLYLTKKGFVCLWCCWAPELKRKITTARVHSKKNTKHAGNHTFLGLQLAVSFADLRWGSFLMGLEQPICHTSVWSCYGCSAQPRLPLWTALLLVAAAASSLRSY